MTTVEVYVDGKPFSLSSAIPIAALRATAGIADESNLWRENRTGRGDDQLLDRLPIVDLKSGDKLYSAPKEING